ncbi:tyrosine-protein phosphatase [Levilactobacillus yonginensis]|uniref:tyrosine-protein phosphatase n=1 Tax=Levilactobacillus yonginensis TaxID=1054041 RepID=UPI000F7B3D03|nr:CpsB/CapC family capsule biosynthesis tyrosine phosphatase [Levilactobacillus yonginensis]
MGLIDVHIHLLPAIDDGPQNHELALQLAEMVVAQGITHAVLTPHHLQADYDNPKWRVQEHVVAFQSALQLAGIPLTVFPGQEVHMTGDLLNHLAADDLLFLDAVGTYLLLELPATHVPLYTEDLLFQLTLRGIIPVLAHPERHPVLQREPERLERLMRLGCLLQVTAGSYLGMFGRAAQKLASHLLVSVPGVLLASDAHDDLRRPCVMAAAFQQLEVAVGSDRCREINDNAVAVVNGESLLTGG